MQTKHIMIVLLGVSLAGGVGFYGGTLYAKSSVRIGPGQQPQMGGAGVRNFRGNQAAGGQMGRGQMGMAAGEVLSVDGQSLSLKLRDGGSKIVFLTASTTVAKLDAGTLGDVAKGVQITVNGAPNADGSLTAQMIQIRPAGLENPGFGRPDQVPAGQPPATR